MPPDIRTFFARKRTSGEISGSTSHSTSNAPGLVSSSVPASPGAGTRCASELQGGHRDYENPNDIGTAVGCSVSDSRRQKLCEAVWVPAEGYDFRGDAASLRGAGGTGTRYFRKGWLSEFPWLAYSRIHKGAFCAPCVLFKQNVESVANFVTQAFTRYHVFHERARQHAASSTHLECLEKASNLRRCLSTSSDVVSLQDKALRLQVEKNRRLLVPIVKSVLFCCEHDLALRGKLLSEGIFKDLLHFRVDAGDAVLASHLKEETRGQNARYLSPQTQNELIECAASALRATILENV
jgi:hypothetical protein